MATAPSSPALTGDAHQLDLSVAFNNAQGLYTLWGNFPKPVESLGGMVPAFIMKRVAEQRKSNPLEFMPFDISKCRSLHDFVLVLAAVDDTGGDTPKVLRRPITYCLSVRGEPAEATILSVKHAAMLLVRLLVCGFGGQHSEEVIDAILAETKSMKCQDIARWEMEFTAELGRIDARDHAQHMAELTRQVMSLTAEDQSFSELLIDSYNQQVAADTAAAMSPPPPPPQKPKRVRKRPAPQSAAAEPRKQQRAGDALEE